LGWRAWVVDMIRAMDKFYEKHPRIACAIAIVAAAVTLYWSKT
jgi:hypothetical protein